ncbi:MAG: hypothetical protein IPO18_04810 [bacterium]|nr:hypothetical protein [bacterium]
MLRHFVPRHLTEGQAAETVAGELSDALDYSPDRRKENAWEHSATTRRAHGITVYAQAGDTVYVGTPRCWMKSAWCPRRRRPCRRATMGRSIDEYPQRAARFGVWKKHDMLGCRRVSFRAVRPLAKSQRWWKRPRPGCGTGAGEW